MKTETPRPEPNADDLQALVERFHRAHWISGISTVSDGPVNLNFTLIGKQRLRRLFGVFDGATDANFPDRKNLRATGAGSILMEHFRDAIAEIYPPPLTPGEMASLMALTMDMAKSEGW